MTWKYTLSAPHLIQIVFSQNDWRRTDIRLEAEKSVLLSVNHKARVELLKEISGLQHAAARNQAYVDPKFDTFGFSGTSWNDNTSPSSEILPGGSPQHHVRMIGFSKIGTVPRDQSYLVWNLGGGSHHCPCSSSSANWEFWRLKRQLQSRQVHFEFQCTIWYGIW
jgi:hypothetical protein